MKTYKIFGKCLPDTPTTLLFKFKINKTEFDIISSTIIDTIPEWECWEKFEFNGDGYTFKVNKNDDVLDYARLILFCLGYSILNVVQLHKHEYDFKLESTNTI